MGMPYSGLREEFSSGKANVSHGRVIAKEKSFMALVVNNVRFSGQVEIILHRLVI
jgi:hypothetical protein